MRPLSGMIGLLAIVVLLGGCTVVYSSRPLFGPEDAAAGPPLKPGVWLYRNGATGTRDDDCPFDPEKPIPKWPACASWTLVRETDVLVYNRDKKTWSAHAYVLTDGAPRVLQLTPMDGEDVSITYQGLAPTAHDQAGRITAFRRWIAQCGDPEKLNDPKITDRYAANTLLLPGLALDESALGCVARERDAVRRSVAASRAWSSDVTEPYWVRDARPGDFARR